MLQVVKPRKPQEAVGERRQECPKGSSCGLESSSLSCGAGLRDMGLGWDVLFVRSKSRSIVLTYYYHKISLDSLTFAVTDDALCSALPFDCSLLSDVCSMC